MNQPPMNLSQMRRDRDVRAKELAYQLGVTPQHLSYVENGHRHSVRLVQRAVALLSAIPPKK